MTLETGARFQINRVGPRRSLPRSNHFCDSHPGSGISTSDGWPCQCVCGYLSLICQFCRFFTRFLRGICCVRACTASVFEPVTASALSPAAVVGNVQCACRDCSLSRGVPEKHVTLLASEFDVAFAVGNGKAVCEASIARDPDGVEFVGGLSGLLWLVLAGQQFVSRSGRVRHRYV